MTASAVLIVSTMAVIVAAGAQPTLAAWNDSEWVVAETGTLSCVVGDEQFSSRASGQLLSGEVLAINLADIAELRGVEVNHSSTEVTVDPVSSDALGDDAYANPLEVSLIGGVINVDLGNVLALPLDTDAGVVNAFAQARDNGQTLGASGAVNDTGAVQLTPVAPGSQPPTLATVELGRLLSAITGAGLGGGIASLADARLDVGAVASRASLDSCAAEWSNAIYDHLLRQYLIASVDLEVDSPLVGALVADTQGALDSVETGVETLAGDTGVVADVTAGVTALVSGLLSTLRLGNVTVDSLSVTLELSGVAALLDDTISDDAGIVAINLASGTVDIDLDGLFGAVHGTTGVNDLPPNTQLLVNAAVITALTDAVTDALTEWVGDLSDALTVALETMIVTAAVRVDLLGVGPSPLATIFLTIPSTSLANLMSGTVAATSSVTLLAGTCGALNPVACLLDSVVGLVVPALINGIGEVMGDALHAAIFRTTAPAGVFVTTMATITSLLNPLITFVSTATAALFGEGSILSLTVNAQNSPDPGHPSGEDVPEWATDLPGPDAASRDSGRYDVAALRLSTLGLLGPGLNVELDFARSSVGSNRAVD